jgi:2-dehydro-3-deoxyglucarate aldolase/4-hydroxy-2-oxoheptanedioate aldolase
VIAQATRYPPQGRRGAAFGFAHDDYQSDSVLETMKAANARTLAIAQIETERGLAEVDEIAAVEGIDVLWVGHFDLTNFLGIPGEFSIPNISMR